MLYYVPFIQWIDCEELGLFWINVGEWGRDGWSSQVKTLCVCEGREGERGERNIERVRERESE